MFIDEAVIFVMGGKGGNGCVSFHRDKHHRAKIPDGGNGGSGGNVVLEVYRERNTLITFHKKSRFSAEKGASGGSSNKTGANGSDLRILVPPGTVVRDEKDNILCDLAEVGQQFVAALGGRSGRGNASMSRETGSPAGFAEVGELGEERKLFLELKLVADVAIVGFPNAGKSSLISRISGAHPKIADYPFTTTEPNLGVVEREDIDFVVTDVPGLIKGAHSGKGMGTEFLRHIERASVIVYLIDMSYMGNTEPRIQLADLEEELGLYDASLLKRTRIVAANKMDLSPPPDTVDGLGEECEIRGLELCKMSVYTGSGVADLLDMLEKELTVPEEESEKTGVMVVYNNDPGEDIMTVDREGDVFVVRGKRIERLVSMTDWNKDDALAHLASKLKRAGVEDVLANAGAVQGDEVVIAGRSFEYYPDEEGEDEGSGGGAGKKR